jgi:hypothetical protein
MIRPPLCLRGKHLLTLVNAPEDGQIDKQKGMRGLPLDFA